MKIKNKKKYISEQTKFSDIDDIVKEDDRTYNSIYSYFTT